MPRYNKSKARTRNDRISYCTAEIHPTGSIEKQESEQVIPDIPVEVKKLWADDDYATGFEETRKSVIRTPPPTLLKRVGRENDTDDETESKNRNKTPM